VFGRDYCRIKLPGSTPQHEDHPVYPEHMGSPAEILRRVFEAYAGCDSYLDKGEVVHVFHVEDETHERRLPFQTLFTRPNRFRYQFTGDQDSLYVVWTEEDDAMSWWSVQPRVRRSESIQLALAGPTGISGGSAFAVPSLLMPAAPYESSWLAESFAGAEHAGREIIDGVETIRLHFVNPSQEFEEPPALPANLVERMAALGGPPLPKLPATRWEWRSLWIAEADATIRRKAERMNLGGRLTDSTMTWAPEMGQSIDPDRFAFVPPTAAKA
jgi:hypothetical protein